MTETKWLVCNDPNLMLGFLSSRASERKLRLFAWACVRSIWRLVPDLGRRAVEVAEEFADGAADADQLQASFNAASRDSAAGLPPDIALMSIRAAQSAAGLPLYFWGPMEWPIKAIRQDGFHRAVAAGAGRLPASLHQAECARQAALLRDLFAPFHCGDLRPGCLAWNDGMLDRLARAIHENKAFQDLPILADALEEAGCTDPAILDHCRGPGPHVRGCWVVDLILGKS
jgi:hypothetical protein